MRKGESRVFLKHGLRVLAAMLVMILWVGPASEVGAARVLIIDSGIGRHDQLPALDPSRWYDAANGHKKPYDSLGHGTFVAGRLLEVYPEVDLYVANVRTSRGVYDIDAVIRAIEWGVSQEVDIINLSLAWDRDYLPAKRAIEEAADKNIILLAAHTGDGLYPYPAGHSAVISVGTTSGDIMADGGCPGRRILGLDTYNRYQYGYGSSYAVPVIAGEMARLRDQHPEHEARELLQILRGDE